MLAKKMNFESRQQIYNFFTVILSGQIIYSAFEAFKGSFYNLLMETLNVNNTQMGTLFSLIGVAMFFYIPGGWVNNRFSVKKILLVSLGSRFVTTMIILIFAPRFFILCIIAFIWGVTDAIFWPAVVNGVLLASNEKNRGMAFGMLESVRRAVEIGMNLLIVGMMTLLGGTLLVFKSAMIIYTILILPMMYLVYKFVPNNQLEEKENESKNLTALKGVITILKMPKVWLASLTALTVYWCYINLIFTVPYLQAVFHISTSQAAIFGVINTGLMGVICGVVSGTLSDYLFKSSLKMMLVSLCLTVIALVTVIFLPKTEAMLWVNIIMLAIFSFSLFLAKGIILAPLAELNLPEEIQGAAMSIGSFATYASVFWAYALNGRIIDANKLDPIKAYETIFLIGATVAIVGAIFAILLLIIKKKENNLTN